MRFRFLPYISTFVVILFVYCFPLLEFDLSWSYVDWKTPISNRTGSRIIDINNRLSFERVPGMMPGWENAHTQIEALLDSVSNVTLPEYSFSWAFKTVNRVSSVKRSFHINNHLGGYIATLYPRSVNDTDEFSSVCFVSNMDSVHGSPGFSANALAVTQSILAVEELSKRPGLRNPITLIITEAKESGSNVLVNMYSFPELQKCRKVVLLDSLGVAQTVPNMIHVSDLSRAARKSFPVSNRYVRVSNWILDTASALSLLSSNEITFMKDNNAKTSISKLVYSDNQFLHHSPDDDGFIAKSAAVKARYDYLVDLGDRLGRIDPRSLHASRAFFDYSSYISVLGKTTRVSVEVQFLLVLTGVVLSLLFLRHGHMGNTRAVSSGLHKAAVILAIQLVVVCVVTCAVLLWFSLDPLVIHKLNPYLLSTVLVLVLSSCIFFSLQLCFYTSYFVRDCAGSMMSLVSIVFGAISVLLILCRIHSSVHFAIPCFLFGATNLFLFLRKTHFHDEIHWKKLSYAASLLLAGVLSFVGNIGGACATLHVVFGTMTVEDLTVNIFTVLSFWCALFPILFATSCFVVIYMNDDSRNATAPSIITLTKAEEQTGKVALLEKQPAAMDKVVHRQFIRYTVYVVWSLVVVIVVTCGFLSPWNSDHPVRVNAGVAYVREVFDFGGNANGTVEGKVEVTTKERLLADLRERLEEVELDQGYAIDRIRDDFCYLTNHAQSRCLQADLSHNGVPVRFLLDYDTFNTSQLYPVRELHNVPINYTQYWQQFRVVVPTRENTSYFGFPFVRVRVYTSKVEHADSKIYANALEVAVRYNGRTVRLKGFVVEGVVLANGGEPLAFDLWVKSRVGSQVIVRVTDISRKEPVELEALHEGLGDGVVYGGLTDTSYLSHTINYYIAYWGVCKKERRADRLRWR